MSDGDRGDEPRPRSRQQAGEAPAPPGRPGDRRLQHDRAGRQGHGLPVRRQGQLCAARHPARPAAARAGRASSVVAVNLDQKQPGFPEHVLPDVPEAARRAVPHREPGHLLDRQAPHPRRQDDVQPVLAAAPRHPVPGRRRARRDQDRARPPPRRHGADALHEHVLRRPPEGHAAQAGQRRRPPRRDPPARLRRRGRPRALGRACATSRSSRARCAAARTTCSACRSARCCATGSASTRAASTTCSTRWPTSCRRTCSIGTSSRSRRSKQPGLPIPPAIGHSILTMACAAPAAALPVRRIS